MRLSDVLDELRSFDWGKYGLYYAILFGSLAKKGEGNDVDIAVEFKGKVTLERYSELWNGLADLLGTEKVDLVVLHEDSSCYLIHEVFNGGLILYMEDWWRAHRRARVCEDFLIDARKLNLIENAGLSILRRWRS
ncbi:MAG: nucleotidyltransferase family protein [Thermoprotei archaeon]